ncbi:cell division protein ZapA [Acidocella facilis]|uniref:cell division protein ZapA n=1 Tax=Acidocella facilis TaxID=525 RepID=UPI00047D5493|nr:cell division protein ZapA [Acidocella facilis]
MAQVTIRINGYAYQVGCEDGQEEHLGKMAAEIEQRITHIKAIGGQAGEARLLMLAALLLADELHDVKTNPPASAPVAATPRAYGERRARLRRVAARAEEIASDLLDL